MLKSVVSSQLHKAAKLNQWKELASTSKFSWQKKKIEMTVSQGILNTAEEDLHAIKIIFSWNVQVKWIATLTVAILRLKCIAFVYWKSS